MIQELKWFGVEFDKGPSRDELRQLGEDWDGAPEGGGPCGPYTQSLRLPRYKEVAEELVAKGFAYRCDCTPEKMQSTDAHHRFYPRRTLHQADHEVSRDH